MCLVRESFCWPGAHSLNIDQTTQQPILYIQHIYPTHLNLYLPGALSIYPPIQQSIPPSHKKYKYSHSKVLHLEVEDLSLRTGHCKDSLTLLEGGTRYKTD